MSQMHFDENWEVARASLQGLSQIARGALLEGLSLEEYKRRSSRMPTAHRPRFIDDHPLLGAPHAMSLALQLMRDDGQLDAIRWLALDNDSGDHRSWKYKHQATVTSLEPLAGLTGLAGLAGWLDG